MCTGSVQAHRGIVVAGGGLLLRAVAAEGIAHAVLPYAGNPWSIGRSESNVCRDAAVAGDASTAFPGIV